MRRRGAWRKTKFDRYLEKLKRALWQSTRECKRFPTEKQERKLVDLVEYEDQLQEVEAFFREIAGSRIILTSSAMWESWLKKPVEVRRRLWDFARAKRMRIESELDDEWLAAQPWRHSDEPTTLSTTATTDGAGDLPA
jgi:hypothetical protein